MRNNKTTDTIIVDSSDSELISKKIAAVNNKARFAILEILRDHEKSNKSNALVEDDPLYSRQINMSLLKDYNIEITTQMLGQHLKQLTEAELIEQVLIRREIPNKVGLRTLKAYVLREDAFEDLFLDISFFTDEILTFFDIYKNSQEYVDGTHCVLTIYNGVDKGKTFTVNKDETVLIGREENFDAGDLASFTILLDNSYTSVSRVSKPHLKLFYMDDNWYIVDESSSNGTFILDKKIKKGQKTKLRNNTFLKLSKGTGSAIIYCSFR